MPPYFTFLENSFVGALALDRFFPQTLRKMLARLCAVTCLGAFGLSFIASAFVLLTRIPRSLPSPVSDQFSRYAIPHFQVPDFITGIGFMALAVWLCIAALDGFFNSKTSVKNGNPSSKNVVDHLNFYASELWYKSSPLLQEPTLENVISSLLKTDAGSATLLRLGVFPKDFSAFLAEIVAHKQSGVSANELFGYIEKNNILSEVTFSTVFSALYEAHEPLKNFFIARGLTKETVTKTAEWVERELTEDDTRRRWWSREALGRIRGFGKNWSYGQVPMLERYAHDLSFEARKTEDIVGREREIKLLESALLKHEGANVLVVGEAGGGKRTILLGLVQMIIEGKIFPELEHKKVYMLYPETLVASGKTKGDSEALILKVLNEAARAGNIILAIDNFPEFVESLGTLGISISELFAPYFTNSNIHFLCLAETQSFRKTLEHNAGLMKHFEKVELDEPGPDDLIRVLEEFAPRIEAIHKNKTLITYPALQKIAESAVQYLMEGGLPKRAIDLMDEVLRAAVSQKSSFVMPDMVMDFVGQKTKMPLGDIGEDEKEKLLSLERSFQKRVVGQNEAITALADAIRRVRSGIRNPKRPIGTFLFLGPTGVGKTETAKTVAEVYFGNEDSMIRFDMTEYQTEDGLEKLIGSFDKKETGLLPSKIRANPYSVVLLDEFEKSHAKVKNLFLQILDEGFFSDYSGQRINMRNTIIIATSNAGASLLWELVGQNTDQKKLRDMLLSHIQKEGIMTPELLNRFDSLIIFKPLSKESLIVIARLMLEKLSSRLKKQNLFLVITDSLIEAVAAGGYDPSFGARPMQRFIQDRVEKIISEKIIRGDIKPGMEFTLTLE